MPAFYARGMDTMKISTDRKEDRMQNKSKHKSTGKKIAVGAGIAVASVAAATAASYMLTRSLVNVALDREAPKTTAKSKKKLCGAAKKPDVYHEQRAQAAEVLKSGEHIPVEIASGDGIRLTGHWYACAHPQRVIIAMHGWRSSWSKDFGSISDFWQGSGCNVLYAEQRGQGESDGAYMGFGLIERYDVLDWIEWVNANGGADLPIYLAGISMGASTVLMAAGQALPANVHGVMADCGYTSPHAIWQHVLERNLHIPYRGINGVIANDMCRKKIQIGAKDYSCTDALRQCRVPVLFVHGTDDRFVPIEMTYENYKACASPKRLFVVPGAVHGMSYLVDKVGYEAAVRQFWQDYDA